MGLLNIFKKKKPEVVEGIVSFVTDENGDKYLHIDQFKETLEDYKYVCFCNIVARPLQNEN